MSFSQKFLGLLLVSILLFGCMQSPVANQTAPPTATEVSASITPTATAVSDPSVSAVQPTGAKPDAITLDGPESLLTSTAMDPQGRFAYVTTWDGKSHLEPDQTDTYYHPAFLKSIRLSDFSENQRISFDRRIAGNPSSIVTDPEGKFIYLQTQQGQVVKIDASDFGKQTSIGLQPGFLVVEGSVTTGPGAVTDPQGKYLYVSGRAGTNTQEIGGRSFSSLIEGGTGPVEGADGVDFFGLYRIDLSEFKNAGFLPMLNDVQGLSLRMWMDPQGRFAYTAYSNPKHLVLARIRLQEFTLDKTIELSQTEGEDIDGALDSKGKYGYFTLSSGKLHQVDLADMTLKTSKDLPEGFRNGPVLLDKQYAYVGGEEGQIARMRLADATWVEPVSIELPETNGEYARVAQSATWDPSGRTAYWGFGQYEGKGQIVKTPLG